MERIDVLYNGLLWLGIFFLPGSMICCLLRAILGPRFTDRIVAVNIVCTKTIIVIAILSHLLGFGGLVDIALVYAMVSFLAVLVLSKCYLLPNHQNLADPPQRREAEKEEEPV